MNVASWPEDGQISVKLSHTENNSIDIYQDERNDSNTTHPKENRLVMHLDQHIDKQ